MTASSLFALLNGLGVGAALFRLRGSSSWQEWTGRGLTSIRLLWAGYLALAAYALDDGTDADWMHGALVVALVLALWLGSIFGWWRSLDMGSHEGTAARDVVMHSLRGLVWTGPAALLVWLAGLAAPWPLILAGALCGPIYWTARKLSASYAVQGGEWGFGFAVASALLFSVAFS